MLNTEVLKGILIGTGKRRSRLEDFRNYSLVYNRGDCSKVSATGAGDEQNWKTLPELEPFLKAEGNFPGFHLKGTRILILDVDGVFDENGMLLPDVQDNYQIFNNLVTETLKGEQTYMEYSKSGSGEHILLALDDDETFAPMQGGDTFKLWLVPKDKRTKENEKHIPCVEAFFDAGKIILTGNAETSCRSIVTGEKAAAVLYAFLDAVASQQFLESPEAKAAKKKNNGESWGNDELLEALQCIPADDEPVWRTVCLGLIGTGFDYSVFDEWAQNTSRNNYNESDCRKLWNRYKDKQIKVTAGTIFWLAMKYGWKPRLKQSDFEMFMPFQDETNKDLPAFPVETFPDAVRQFCTETAVSLQVAPDMIACAVLGMVALCCQGKYKVQLKSDYSEPVNLYLACIADPAERKSATLQQAREPIIEYQLKTNKERELKVRADEINIKRLKKELDMITDSRKQTGKKKSQDEGFGFDDTVNESYSLSDRINAKLQEIQQAEQEQIHFLKLMLSDSTSEAVIQNLKNNDEKTAIVSDEGGIFDIMAGSYSDQGRSLIDIYLQAYSGTFVSVSRVSRDDIELKHPLLSMVLFVQPKVIENVMGNDEFQRRGLVARFLYSFPKAMAGNRVSCFDTQSISPETKKGYSNLLRELLEYEPPSEDVLKMSNGAIDCYRSFHDEMERKFKNDADDYLSTAFKPWANRIPGNTVRIAGLLHIMKYRENSNRLPIEADTMKKAVLMGRYFLAHALTAYEIGNLLDTQAEADAKYFLHKLTNAKYTKITKRDFFAQCRGVKRFSRVKAIEPGLAELVSRGYIRIQSESPSDKGRKSEVIYVNPEWMQI